MAICNGEMNAYNDDRACTDDRFPAIESKIDNWLQKMDAAWTENTVLNEAYRASREETAALKAAVDTLMTKLDENITISAPPSPDTATTSSMMEEMMTQLSHIQNDIQDILDAVRNPPGKRTGCTSNQDNELMTLTNR
jgi:predicted nuclease with TOPRIM domain